jgi:hypothetical protein
MEHISNEEYQSFSDEATISLPGTWNIPEIARLIEGHKLIQSRAANEELKADLIEHVWNFHGST